MGLKHSSGVPQCNRLTRMPLTTKSLLCKQTIDNFPTRPSLWHHLSGNRVSFFLNANSDKKRAGGECTGDKIRTMSLYSRHSDRTRIRDRALCLGCPLYKPIVLN